VVPFEAAAEDAGMTYAAWVPLRLEGEPDRLVIVIAADLTEYDFLVVRLYAAQLKNAIRIGRLSRELVHRERLAAVGEMAAVLAHEVRNPLGVMFNVVGGLRRCLGDDPEAAHLVDILREESERLERFVGDLLDYSRPRPPTLQVVSARALVEDALSTVRASGEEAFPGRTLWTELDPGPLEARVDPELLRRALINLLVNAQQHTPEGGRIGLTARRTGSRLELSISNTGPAIAEEDRERVFQPFFTTRAQGTGLGLAVARRIVEDLRGELTLASTDPVRFEIALPIPLW